MTYRLGIDIGTNSLGWCVLHTDGKGQPSGIRDIGVRIFSDGRDPQSGTSLAVDRRTARGMRRRRDRYLLRRQDLMKALIAQDLMPKDEAERKALEKLDPYEIRARGLDEKITLHELGRAIFHLNQRRGFRSNRKTDRTDDDKKESGKIKTGANKLTRAMKKEGARTIGEFLYRRHKERKPVRTRLSGEGAKAEYDFYPQRAMLEDEFMQLWQDQARYHKKLSAQSRDALFAIVFRQRPLRPVDPGKCSIIPEDSRAPWALPLCQEFRILKELANLKIISPDLTERPLAKDQRDILLKKLQASKTVGFNAMRKALELETGTRFNLEDQKRKGLDGDRTSFALAHKDRFGKAWQDLPFPRRNEIVERLLSEENENALVSWLMDETSLSKERALVVADVPLPDGYMRFGRKILGLIHPLLSDETLPWTDPKTGEVLDCPIGEAEAIRLAGHHHSDRRPEDILERLPYYGQALERHVSGSGDPDHGEEKRFGRIANPTVHIGLNQTRRLVNALIERYGHPGEIVIELARELKLSKKQKDAIQKEQAENQDKNDKRRKKLADLKEKDNGENRMKLRLWEELNPDDVNARHCIYTGEKISIKRLFSPEVEIEHILPFSRTLDNGAANRTVAMRFANRAKVNQSPFEAFGHGPTIAGHAYDWEGILERVAGLTKNKQWRFGADAMGRFERDERGFLDRQLTDTAYLSKAAKEYLGHVCDPDRVRAIPGRLTALLRGKWGLNSLLSDANLKNRTDHRHHAIDAVVAAVTGRGMLQRIANASGDSRERLIDDMPEPWDGFRDDLRDALSRVTVSHKPDRGKQGKLHEETAYGLIADPKKEDGCNLVYRKPIMGLNENEIKRIRDRDLRLNLTEHIASAKKALGVKKLGNADLKKALGEFSEKTGVRRVRLLKKETGVIAITGPGGDAYKAYIPGDNHCIEIFETPDGKWAGEALTVFQANQNDHVSHWRQKYPTARQIMRVHKGDLLKLDHDGEERVMRVVRLNAKSNRFYLAGHLESGDLQKRHDDKGDPFRWFFASFGKLPEYRARKVSVDVTGRVRDPGFRE